MQKSLLQDEAQSSLDGNDRLASSSDIHSAHTDNQSVGKHTLGQLDENSVLPSRDQQSGRLVKIKSPTKEPLKSREAKLRERTIDHSEGASSSASVHFHQGEDQLNAVLTSSPSVSNQPATSSDQTEQSTGLVTSQQTNKLTKSNLKTDSYGEPVSKNIYVNVDNADNQSSKTSTSTKLRSKSDYIWMSA